MRQAARSPANPSRNSASFGEQLVDADGLGLAGDGDQVEFAHLDLVLRQAQRVFGDDHARSVHLVDAFEPGGEVDRIADNREGFGNRRADRADYHLARRDAASRRLRQELRRVRRYHARAAPVRHLGGRGLPFRRYGFRAVLSDMPAVLRSLAGAENSIERWWQQLEAATKHSEGSGRVVNALAMAASYDPDPPQF